LTKTIQLFKSVFKDRLFYNRFEYSIGFYLQEVSCLRELNHAYIDTMIQRRIAWREVAQQRWHKSNNITTNILARRRREISKDTIQDLHEIADLLLSTGADFKLVVSANHAHVYTNDLALIDQLSNLPSLEQKYYSRAIVTRPRDTIRLKNPLHQFRSYFKSVKLINEHHLYLKNFLTSQPDIRVSPAFQNWLEGVFNRTQDYFFVDHDSMQWLTMLGLVRPGLIRKTMQIIPANK